MKLYIRGSDTRKVIYIYIFVTTIKIEIGVREYRSSLLIRSYNYPVLLWNLKLSITRRISFECDDFLNLFQPPKLTREFKRKNFQSTRYSDFEMRTLKTSISHPRSDYHIYSPDEDQLSSNIDWNFLLREYIFLIRVQREREERWMRIRGAFPTLENVSYARDSSRILLSSMNEIAGRWVTPVVVAVCHVKPGPRKNAADVAPDGERERKREIGKKEPTGCIPVAIREWNFKTAAPSYTREGFTPHIYTHLVER